jgi:iron(III) transport system substrate-binding protein
MRINRTRILASLAVALLLLPGLAAAAEVVLYSSNPSELIDRVGKGFEAKTGIKVSVVRMGTGEAMKRIAAEKDKPLCDVFWSGDVAVLENAKAYFQPYRSPEAAGLPAGYVEKDALWTASNAHVMIVMLNKGMVKDADAPKTWQDLLDPRWKGKVVMANPEK